MKAAGYKIDTDLATGISIPVVFLMVAFGLKWVRRLVGGKTKPDPEPDPHV